MNSVLIVNLPKYDLNAPCAATAVLISVANDNNYKAYESDFNVYLHKHLTEEEWIELDVWTVINTTSNALKERIIVLWDEMIKDALPDNCEYLCISIFSYSSLHVSKLILEHEKTKEETTYKIIVGGNGTASSFPDSSINFTTWANTGNYVDFIVSGDGESAFAEIITKSSSKYDVNNLDTMPFPSYTDFNFNDYSDRKVYITGSRGCVRSCTYCDINEVWTQFRYRSAESIVQEIKQHYYETGIEDYDFTDSLINGSTTNFYKFNALLAEEKEKCPDLKNITYRGQFICKAKKTMPASHFEAMHYAGCFQLTTGIESFSEKIRHDMRKKFSDEDLDHYLEQCARWSINSIFLMIVGYPTETEKEHRENCEGLYKYKKYADTGVIELIRFGTTMKIINGTPVAQPKLFNELGLGFEQNETNSELNYYWYSKHNPNNTLYTRIKRRIEIHDICVELNYPQPRLGTELNELKELAKVLLKNKNKIYVRTN